MTGAKISVLDNFNSVIDYLLAPLSKGWHNTALHSFTVLVFLSIAISASSSGIGQGLDPSWGIALMVAVKQKLMFGSDVVFTYGPLFWLETGIVTSAQWPWFILAHLIIGFGYARLVRIIIGSNPSKLQVFITGLSILTLSYLPFLVLKTLVLIIFELSIAFYKGRFRPFIIPVIIAPVLVFIKLNVGIIAAPLVFTAVVAHAVWFRRNMQAHITAIGYIPAMTVMLSLLLETDLYSYLSNGLAIIRGYTDSMQYDELKNHMSIAASCMLVGFYLLVITSWLFSTTKTRLLPVCILFSGFLLMVFKQGLTRIDVYHVYDFFDWYITSLAIFCYFISDTMHPKTQTMHKFSLVAMVALLVGFGVFMLAEHPIRLVSLKTYQISKLWNQQKAPYLTSRGAIFANQLASYQIGNSNRIFPKNCLPEDSLSTADVFPYNVSDLFYNNITYKQRPVCQSYSAYTPKLAALNAAFYASDDSPTYVYMGNGSIDMRHPFADDFLAKQQIRSKYKLLKTFSLKQQSGTLDTLLQLQLEETPMYTRLVTQDTIKGNVYTWVVLPNVDNKDAVFAPILKPNLLGKISGQFWHINAYIEIVYADSSKYLYKTSPMLLELGYPLAKINSAQDVIAYFTSTATLVSAVKYRIFASKNYFKVEESFTTIRKYQTTSN